MSLYVLCTGCNQDYKVPDGAAGKQIRCPKGHILAVPARGSPLPAPSGPPAHEASRQEPLPDPSRSAGPVAPPRPAAAPQPAMLDLPQERPARWGRAVVVCAGFLVLLLAGGGTAVVIMVKSAGPAVENSGESGHARGLARGDAGEENGGGHESGRASRSRSGEQGREGGPLSPGAGEETAKPAAAQPKPARGSANPEQPPRQESDNGSKLVLRAFDQLDASKLDVVLPPPKPQDKPPAVLDGHTNHVRSVAFTPNGQFVLSVSGDTNRAVSRPPDNSIRVWDARRGLQVHKVEGFREALDSLSISPGGRFALFAAGGYWDRDSKFNPSTDHGVYMWDIQSKTVIEPSMDLTAKATPPGGDDKPKPRFLGLNGQVFSTAISADRKTVAAGDREGQLMLWETGTGREIVKGEVRKIKGFINGICCVKFTPDGRHLVIACADDTIRLYKTETAQLVYRPLESHLDIVWALDVGQTKDGGLQALSGGGWRQRLDGRGFEPGARDYAIRLWNLDEGKVIRRFTGHEGPVLGLAFCPDGRHFVSGSYDGTVRLWDLESGKELRVLGRLEEGVTSVAVSPDGRSCVSGGFDCKVRFWQLPTVQDLVEALDKDSAAGLRTASRDMDVIGIGALAAFPRLMKNLGHKDPEFRRLAAQILVRLADQSRPKDLPFDKSHVPALLGALEADRSVEMQALAAQALGQITPAAPEAVPVLLKLFEDQQDARVARAVVEALGKVGVKGRQVTALLATALAHEDAAVRAESIRVLEQLAPEALTPEALVERLGYDSSADVRDAAEKALRERFPSLTARDVPVLRKGLKSDRPAACVCCAEAVALLRGAGAVPELTALLKRPTPEVRLAALRALKVCGEPAKFAVPELVRLLAEERKPEAATEVTIALLRIDPDNSAIVTRVIPKLVEALKPTTAGQIPAALAQPLESPAARTLLEIGEPAVWPLCNDGLKAWLPKKSENKDVAATVARYQVYMILEELAVRAAKDDKLLTALKKWENGFRFTFVPKEKALAREAANLVRIRQLGPEDSEPYAKAAAAAQAVFTKVVYLRSTVPAK